MSPARLARLEASAVAFAAPEAMRVAVGLGVDRRVDRHARPQDDRRAELPASSTIFTGMRWTTLVKLPVALSGGSSANSWPLAGERLSTRPLKTWPGNVSTSISTGWPARTLVSCVSL